MNYKLNTILLILLLIGIIILIFKKSNDTITSKHYFTSDTLVYRDTLVYNYTTKPTITNNFYEAPDVPVDTDAVVKDYFTKYALVDTIKNDSSALIVVRDTLYKNSVWYRNTTFKNNRPTQVVTNNYTFNYRELFIDGAIKIDDNMAVGVGGSFKYHSNRYGIKYYTDKTVQLEYGRRIWNRD